MLTQTRSLVVQKSHLFPIAKSPQERYGKRSVTTETWTKTSVLTRNVFLKLNIRKRPNEFRHIIISKKMNEYVA